MPLPALTELRQEPRCGAGRTSCACLGRAALTGARNPAGLASRPRRRENAAAWIASRELALPGVRTARKAVERHYFAGAVPTLLQVRPARGARAASHLSAATASLTPSAPPGARAGLRVLARRASPARQDLCAGACALPAHSARARPSAGRAQPLPRWRCFARR